jgi:hypothetical protein
VRPRDEVYNTLAGRLVDSPQLQVLDPVVRTLAVPVVHVFVEEERPSEMLAHDNYVLEDSSVRPGVWMTWPVDPDIACRVWQRPPPAKPLLEWHTDVPSTPQTQVTRIAIPASDDGMPVTSSAQSAGQGAATLDRRECMPALLLLVVARAEPDGFGPASAVKEKTQCHVIRLP